jgi:hypothetical protein
MSRLAPLADVRREPRPSVARPREDLRLSKMLTRRSTQTRRLRRRVSRAVVETPPSTITPIAVAVREDLSTRRWSGAQFGLRGTAWSTEIGVTLAAAELVVRGRGWEKGSGDWKMPRGRHPVTIGLSVFLLVRSRLALTVPRHFVSPVHGERSLVVEEWDIDAVRAWVDDQVRAIGPIDRAELVPRLQEIFWVDDPDEDDWTDIPPEDEPGNEMP